MQQLEWCLIGSSTLFETINHYPLIARSHKHSFFSYLKNILAAWNKYQREV